MPINEQQQDLPCWPEAVAQVDLRAGSGSGLTKIAMVHGNQSLSESTYYELFNRE